MTQKYASSRREALGLIVGTAGGALLAARSASAAQMDASAFADAGRPLTRGYVKTQAGQVHYWSAGTGPILLCVHQSGNSSAEYLGLVPFLAEHFRLVAVDLPGHGLSFEPREEPTVDTYASAVEAVIDHLRLTQMYVLGHHGGAMTVMNLVARQPAAYPKVILSGTSGLRSSQESQAFMEQLRQTDTTVRKDSDFVATAWDNYVSMLSEGGQVKDIVEPFIAFLDARLRPHRAIFVYLKWDRRAALEQLTMPVLLIQGGRDRYVSKQESLLAMLPKGSRVELPGCGTFMFYDRPDLCASVIRSYLTA